MTVGTYTIFFYLLTVFKFYVILVIRTTSYGRNMCPSTDFFIMAVDGHMFLLLIDLFLRGLIDYKE